MSTYKLLSIPGGVIRIDDGAFIPATLDNVDWKTYQKWLTDGNIPVPATVPTQAELNEFARLAGIDTVIQADDLSNLIKNMSNTEYDAWWVANVANLGQANAVLKRVVRILCRRVL